MVDFASLPPICLATGNPHKLSEVQQILAPAGLEVISLMEKYPDLEEPVEDQPTFEGNAQLKARYYAKHTGQLCLADDSGLEVDALNGEPGVYSARYAGVTSSRAEADQANNAKMVNLLKDIPFEQRTARFVCAIALCSAKQDYVLVRGTIEGLIQLEPTGENGFGYDPHFYVPRFDCTTASLSPEQKNEISHRGEALRKMLKYLQKLDLSG